VPNPELELREPRKADIYVQAAAFYVACLKAGFSDEATEFQEWFLETFDIDLED
jgi:hypothetical protein